MTTARYDCAGITKHGRQCERRATKHFVRRQGSCSGHYCAQHARGAGIMRMLLPMPWEYDHVDTYGAGR
jgi:hypothetical protein